MKSMNKQDVLQRNWLERIAHGVGDKLEKIAGDSCTCWNFVVYEPELTAEMLDDMIASK